MTRQILFLLFISILASCKTPVEKPAYAIENESLRYDIKNPKLGKGYLSGMTKNDVFNHPKDLESSDKLVLLSDSTVVSRIETENFILTNHTSFYYYKGLLYQKISHISTDSIQTKGISDSDFKSEALDYVKKHYGDNYHSNGTQESKLYWVEDGVRIDFFDTLDIVHVSFTDILFERTIKSENNRADREEAVYDKDMAL